VEGDLKAVTRNAAAAAQVAALVHMDLIRL